jgi:hypothetical protein
VPAASSGSSCSSSSSSSHAMPIYQQGVSRMCGRSLTQPCRPLSQCCDSMHS